MHRALLFALLLPLAAPAAERKIAFSQGAIHVANLDGTGPKRIASGSWPDISPDGTKVAFNTESEKSPARHIAVAEIATGRTLLFEHLPSDNCHRPVWSPDGRQLVFYYFQNDVWHLGLVQADGTGFQAIPTASADGDTLWGAAWARDGQSLFAQDLAALYRLDLHGKVLQQWKLSELFPEASLNSGARLAPSPDGRTLLIDVDMADEVERPGWDGPPPAIWQLDLAAGRATQVTKTALFAWHPAWIGDHEILCNHTPAGSDEIAVYRLSLPDGPPQLVIGHARDATVSAP